MILYLDTSALLKLYLDETGSPQIRQAVRDATATCTHIVTYAEACAALTHALRLGRISESDCDAQVRAFDADWVALQVVSVDEHLIRRAGSLARQHGLRGYDCVHLAAAERVSVAVGASDFVFAGFDDRLNEAAAALGLRLLNEAC